MPEQEVLKIINEDTVAKDKIKNKLIEIQAEAKAQKAKKEKIKKAKIAAKAAKEKQLKNARIDRAKIKQKEWNALSEDEKIKKILNEKLNLSMRINPERKKGPVYDILLLNYIHETIIFKLFTTFKGKNISDEEVNNYIEKISMPYIKSMKKTTLTEGDINSYLRDIKKVVEKESTSLGTYFEKEVVNDYTKSYLNKKLQYFINREINRENKQ